MKINELIKKIELRYPLSTALGFDNTGASILINNNEISGVLICIDVTLSAIEYAYKNNINLIVSHHPLIFDSLKNLNISDMVSKRIKKLIQYEINSYSIHTNFDTNIKYGMGTLFINKLFKKSEISKHKYFKIYDKNHAIGDIVILKKGIFINNLVNKIFSVLSVSKDKGSFYIFNNKFIKKIAILPGAGSSDISFVIKEKCDCYVTSDLKHNNIVDLYDAGISYINPTHFSMENIFVPYIQKFISSFIKSNVKTYSCVDF